MGYFTETMNAIFETKGEVAADHSTERTGIKTSGDHQIGKYIRDNKATTIALVISVIAHHHLFCKSVIFPSCVT